MRGSTNVSDNDIETQSEIEVDIEAGSPGSVTETQSDDDEVEERTNSHAGNYVAMAAVATFVGLQLSKAYYDTAISYAGASGPKSTLYTMAISETIFDVVSDVVEFVVSDSYSSIKNISDNAIKFLKFFCEQNDYDFELKNLTTQTIKSLKSLLSTKSLLIGVTMAALIYDIVINSVTDYKGEWKLVETAFDNGFIKPDVNDDVIKSLYSVNFVLDSALNFIVSLGMANIAAIKLSNILPGTFNRCVSSITSTASSAMRCFGLFKHKEVNQPSERTAFADNRDGLSNYTLASTSASPS